MEQISRGQFLARLNFQERFTEEEIASLRQQLLVSIEQRTELFSIRVTLQQLDFDGMGVTFFDDDDEGLSFHAKAKPSAGFPTPR